jgi:polyhydroxyalkanoate synthase
MSQRDDVDNLATPLDTLLIDAGLSPLRRFLPNASTAKFAARLATRPVTTARRLRGVAVELGRVALGTSPVEPSRRDRRFEDDAWRSNPWLKRLAQSYLVGATAAEQLVGDAQLEWRDDRRVRFLVQNLAEAFAPSNLPLVNPASAKAAVDTGGLSLVRGARNFLGDMSAPPRVPEMVDGSGFHLGLNVAVTPGAVVFRSEVLELIQYTPQTERVRAQPLLIIPPTINKFYATDLAPGRSLVEYLVASGQQVFMVSWRNPDGRHADWGLTHYVRSCLEALEVVERITGTERTVLAAACSGGTIASMTAAYLSATGQAHRLSGLTLLVTVLDNEKAGEAAAFADRRLVAAAKAVSRRKGYLDGRHLAEVFAWLRPGDLVWNYWVNNYLCGNRPPAFDILFWNSDTTRMTAQLHADFIDVAIDNLLVSPGGVSVDDVPIDLARISTDAYVLAGIADHITPWENCYRTTGLLGGEVRFVLSRSGHIAALVNPPTNPKATFQLNPKNPDTAKQWLAGASQERGSWWPDWNAWLAEHSGPERPASAELGGAGLEVLAPAPGTYVFDR